MWTKHKQNKTNALDLVKLFINGAKNAVIVQCHIDMLKICVYHLNTKLKLIKRKNSPKPKAKWLQNVGTANGNEKQMNKCGIALLHNC